MASKMNSDENEWDGIFSSYPLEQDDLLQVIVNWSGEAFKGVRPQYGTSQSQSE